MGARREVLSAVAERYRSAKRAEKGRILDELCATTGWHRKHAVRALRQRKTVAPGEFVAVRERSRRYGTTTKDALTALWEASDRRDLSARIPSGNAPNYAHKKRSLAPHRARTLGIRPPRADKKVVDSRAAARPRLLAVRRPVGAVHTRTPPVGGMRRRQQELGRHRKAAVVVRAGQQECQRLSPSQAQNQSPQPL
jgi:hypothetical protein